MLFCLLVAKEMSRFAYRHNICLHPWAEQKMSAVGSQFSLAMFMHFHKSNFKTVDVDKLRPLFSSKLHGKILYCL